MESQDNLTREHYNLRWNNYTNNLIQVFSEHQHHEIFVDVTLTCEGQFIKAHKLILSACSGFFQEMFSIHSSIQHPFIILNGIKFNHLKHIIEFIYHGEIKILDEDLEGVLALGESFQVKGLSSVKLKHQVSTFDGTPLTHPSPAPISSTQNLLPSMPVYHQQKENIRSFLNTTNNNQNISKVQSGRTFKRVQIINNGTSDNNKTEQNKLDNQLAQDCKDEIEPVIKRTKTPKDTTTNDGNIKPVENIQKETAHDIEKIPRPANAFMIFANEWRKKLAVEHPDENNKGISVRLGNMWKSLSTETKESYYLAAKRAQREHALKYPGYIYNPQEARKRKANREKTADSNSQSTFVDMQECNEDDDLQIIEINEDQIDTPDRPDDPPE